MTNFRKRSKTDLRNLSLAAEWMMRRNVSDDHWWRSTVLTKLNPDSDKSRPNFNEDEAQKVFNLMIDRGLLVERKNDSPLNPSYVMKYDLAGWDKAVSDGRWIRGKWLYIKRHWKLILITFIASIVLATLEGRIVGIIDGWIDSVISTESDDTDSDSISLVEIGQMNREVAGSSYQTTTNCNTNIRPPLDY